MTQPQDEHLEKMVIEVLQPLAQQPLSKQGVFDSIFNLTGYAKILLEMEKEQKDGERQVLSS